MDDRRKFFSSLGAAIGALFFRSRVNADTLSDEQIVKAWEDPQFRNLLTEAQWEALPENPAGKVDRAEYSGDLAKSTANNCSGNNCSGNNCSGNNCSGNNCSGNNCSGNNCSGNNCSGNNCGGF